MIAGLLEVVWCVSGLSEDVFRVSIDIQPILQILPILPILPILANPANPSNSTISYQSWPFSSIPQSLPILVNPSNHSILPIILILSTLLILTICQFWPILSSVIPSHPDKPANSCSPGIPNISSSLSLRF